MSAHRVFASVLRLLIGFAESLGLQRAFLLERVGLSQQDLEDPDELVPYESLVLVWRELVARFPSAPLGLRYASMWTVDGLGVVGYTLRHARDGHEAIALTLRFSRLVDPYIRIDIEQPNGRHIVRIEHEPRVVAMVEPMEMLVLAMVRLATSLFREEVKPMEICFRHTARHGADLYADVVGPGVPVRFDAAFNGVVFPSALLDLPLADADPRMASYLAKHAEVLLQESGAVEASLEERVRRVVSSTLASGRVDATRVAKELGLSVRSLQRELQSRSTSFSHEVDGARKERALLLLRRPELNVAEIAFMLGYAESRVFLRSFRRWTGLTPTQFRRAE